MRVIAAAVKLGENRLVAFVRDATGKPRRVDFRWTSREATDVAPEVWCQAVQAELQHQDSGSDVLAAFRKQR